MYAIVAMDDEGGIGLDGSIPWNNKADMRFFRTQTVGSAVVMGYKTWESLGVNYLPSRYNIVLTRKDTSSPTLAGQGIKFKNSISVEYLNRFPGAYLIGGSQIYKSYLRLCDGIFVSRIPGKYNCDAFFEIPTHFYKIGDMTVTHKDDSVLVEKYIRR